MDPTTGIVQDVTVTALNIRRGDVFTRHRRQRTATHDACRHGQFSVVVEFEGGGVVYLPINAEIVVTRVVRRRATWSATA
ncbi:hypothetical protein ACWDX6_23845 [Streptomyces sp. NPDC003027]